jgi:hypothetical protein
VHCDVDDIFNGVNFELIRICNICSVQCIVQLQSPAFTFFSFVAAGDKLPENAGEKFPLLGI